MAKKPTQSRLSSSRQAQTTPPTNSLSGVDAPPDVSYRELATHALEYILQQMPTDLWTCTPDDNRIVFQSNLSIELWGDLQGHQIGEINIPSELIARLQKNIDTARSGKTVEYETELPVTAAQTQTYYNKVCPVLGEDQNTVGILGICRDITEQKDREQLQIARRKLAERLNEATSFEEALKLCFETSLRISRIKWICVTTIDEKDTCRILFYSGVPKKIRDRIHGTRIDTLAHLDPERTEPLITTPGSYHPDFAAIMRQHNIKKLARFPMCQEGRAVAALSMAVRGSEEIPQWCIDELKIIASQTETAIARIRTREQLKADQRLLRELFQLQEQERHLLSSEIHDGFIQDIVGAQMVFETLIKIGNDMNSECPELFENANKMLGHALKSARSFISEIRPLIIEEEGVLESVNFLVNHLDLPVSKKIIYTHGENVERFNPIIEGIAFRLIQEGLKNAIHHSQANTIKIHLAESKETLLIRIEDDGIGFDPQAAIYKGFGVNRILEKPSLFGGSSKIQSEPGKGTTIHIALPVIRMDNEGQEPVRFIYERGQR